MCAGDGAMTKTKRIHLIAFAIFIVWAQWYFTILSTQHALHNMPATCPVCTLVNQLDHSVVPEFVITPVVITQLFLVLPTQYVIPVSRIVSYDSRAPPA
jgi:hypothetical protein